MFTQIYSISETNQMKPDLTKEFDMLLLLKVSTEKSDYLEFISDPIDNFCIVSCGIFCKQS